MTNEDRERLAQIKARLKAALSGEWAIEPDSVTYLREYDVYYFVFYGASESVACAIGKADAEFIDHAKPDMEWMSERIEGLEAEREDTLDTLTTVREQRNDLWRMFETQRKWARRWKIAAKDNRGEYMQVKKMEAELYSTEGINRCNAIIINDLRQREEENKARIAALENAARSCATCVNFDPHPHAPARPECGDCRLNNYCCWVLDEKQFAEKGSAEE